MCWLRSCIAASCLYRVLTIVSCMAEPGLERCLRAGDEGLARVRRRRSAEQIAEAKTKVAARREAAATRGDDPKSSNNFVSIRTLWMDHVDGWDLEISTKYSGGF